MKFFHPSYLYLLFALVPMTLFSLIYFKRHRRDISLFFTLDQGENAIKNFRASFGWAEFFFLLFFGNIIIALADPYWGTMLVSETRHGLDVVLAVDVSRSMNVRDIPGGQNVSGSGTGGRNGDGIVDASRLERAVSLAQALVNNFPGVRFGLAIGRGSGLLSIPLTDDSEAVLNYLGVISSEAVSGGGTNLENLIDAASGAFQGSSPARRRIVLLTDGESLSGSVSAALDRLRGHDISIIAVGLGSAAGAAVPVKGGGFLSRSDGSLVLSALHADALGQAASRSGGIYIDGSRSDAAGRLFSHLNALLDDSLSGGFRREPYRRWRVFLAAGLVCLALSRVIRKSTIIAGFGRTKA